MANYHFVYRPLDITSIGGVVPNLSESDGAYLGQIVCGDWYAGYVTDPKLLMHYKAYGFIPLSENDYDGIDLYAKAGDSTSYIDVDGSEHVLTGPESTKRDDGKQFINKLELRGNIDSTVGDLYDLISDIAKRMAIVERGHAHLMDKVLNSVAVPTDYSDLSATLLTDTSSGVITDIIDISGDSLSAIYTKLKTRINNISTILANYFT